MARLERDDWRGLLPHPTAAGRPGPFIGRGPANYAVRDETIFERVCEALADDGELDASLLRVHVRRGEVALVGDIADDRQRELAIVCARTVRGVRTVHDHLRVGPHGRATS